MLANWASALGISMTLWHGSHLVHLDIQRLVQICWPDLHNNGSFPAELQITKLDTFLLKEIHDTYRRVQDWYEVLLTSFMVCRGYYDTLQMPYDNTTSRKVSSHLFSENLLWSIVTRRSHTDNYIFYQTTLDVVPSFEIQFSSLKFRFEQSSLSSPGSGSSSL